MSRWTEVKESVYSAMVDAIGKAVIYEPNDDTTRQMAIQAADGIVEPLVGDGVIFDYQLMCDSENNDDEVLRCNSFVLTFGWKEHDGDEWTLCDFTVPRTPGECEVHA